jgi:hypothetical protein
MANELAVVPSGTDYQTIKDMALMVAKSAFYSDASSMERAATVMLQGYELGLPPMAAMRNIYVVKGKPCLSSNLMAALVLKAGHPRIQVVKLDNNICTLRARRKGEGAEETTEFSYTMKDAELAGLGGSEAWKKHPRNMLYARAVGNICRLVFPDLFAGLYTPEEMDDNALINTEYSIVEASTGEVKETVTTPEPKPKTEPVKKMTFQEFVTWMHTKYEGEDRAVGAKIAEVFQCKSIKELQDQLAARGIDNRFQWITDNYEQAAETFLADNYEQNEAPPLDGTLF